MRRSRILILIALAVVALVGVVVVTRSEEEASTATPEELRSGVGRVETLNCDGTPFVVGGHAASGSGFLIGSQVVMSAEHGMWVGLDEPACKMRVRFGDETYPVMSVRVWGEQNQNDFYARRGVDIATLTLGRPVDAHVFKLASEGAPVGTPIATLGYPMGGPLKITRGAVTKNVIDYEVPSIAAKINIEGGNSGGPILNNDGEVLGVVSRIVISGSLTEDKSNRWGGVDIPRWWRANAVADLCLTYPGGGIPECDDQSDTETTKRSVVLSPRTP